MNAIGVRIEFNKQKYQDLLKAARLGQLQMFSSSATTTTRGLRLFRAALRRPCRVLEPRALQAAGSRPLYEQARGAPNGPEREALMHKMGDLVTPTRLGPHRTLRERSCILGAGLQVQRLQPASWAYFDIDIGTRAMALRQMTPAPLTLRTVCCRSRPVRSRSRQSPSSGALSECGSPLPALRSGVPARARFRRLPQDARRGAIAHPLLQGRVIGRM
jgi:hypothetical protein